MHSSRKDFNLTALWNNSADDKSVLFAYFSQKIGFDICMQIVPLGDILHEMPVYFQGRIEMLKGFLSKIMHGKLIFFLFSPENRFDILYKLSPKSIHKEASYMKCQSLFSEKNKAQQTDDIFLIFPENMRR